MASLFDMETEMTFIPSPQQSAFLDWVSHGSGSCVLEAVAGAGKTTTLLEAVDRCSGGVAILAYNRKIADEIKAKLRKRGVDWKQAEANTVHGFGLRAYKKTFPGVVVDGRKVSNIVAEMSVDAGEDHPLRAFSEIICKLVSLAKQRALGVIGAIDDDSKWYDICDHFDLTFDEDDASDRLAEIVEQAQRILRLSNRRTDVIDFDDMVYLPVFLKLRFWQYGWVFVDEAQDTNPARRALVRALVRPGGRMVAVGDRCQPEGTMVSVPVENTRWARSGPKSVPIEKLSVGDKVVSYSTADCAFMPKGRRVNGVTKRPYAGTIIIAESESGVSSYTPSHLCLVNMDGLREKHGVYVMRKGHQYRIGKCRMSYSCASGISARMRDENADAVWLLGAYDTEAEAFFHEQAISGRFGLPQLMFNPKKMMRGPSSQYLPMAWEFIGDNEMRADECLTYFHQDIRYPLFASGSGKQMTIKRPIVVRASCLIDGVKMLPYHNAVHIKKSDWVSVKIRRKHYAGNVVSLDVEGTHLYVADNLVTHNCQAIYGFTGADADSLDLIRQDFNAVEMPLTTTYRCPKEIVGVARQWVSHIEAHESAPDGIVSTIAYNDLFDRNDLGAGTAILCRNTKPLVKLAFQLIRRRVACRVEGRDIGNGLKKIATKWQRVRTLHGLEEQLTKWCDAQVKRAMAKGNDQLAQTVQDQKETIFVIAEECRRAGKDSLKAVCDYIDDLFADDVASMLVLSTIHRAKGREWDTVYWLDRAGTLPSPFARQKWQIEQEHNLCYVAATRAKQQLIEVLVPRD